MAPMARVGRNRPGGDVSLLVFSSQVSEEFMRRIIFFLFFQALFLTTFLIPATAQSYDESTSPLLAHPRDRVTATVDEQRRILLPGNRHPLARAEYDRGAVLSSFRMDHMILTLKPDPAQQQALDELVAAQHDPDSPYYHQWLTPQSYGEQFGISEDDLAQVTAWLQEHGMTINEVTAGRRAIVFSGTAGQVGAAFHTQIHSYRIGAALHHANSTDPEIPQALAGVVGGVVSLHDFRTQAQHRPFVQLNRPAPSFTSGGSHYLAPADFATIYNLGPLYQQSITGTGQSVAIVGRININLSDVRTFRSSFGLPANDPQIIVNGTDPGIWDSGEEVEADLDVEWSGAVAKNAAIKFVVSASTYSSDGVYLSAQYIVNHNLAPVMSTSFGACEAALGASGNSFINSLWQQAAAEGITVFVSSGDSGAAGCDSSSATTATHGLGINGLCSSPYSVCVGGTQFNDAGNPGLYWASSNTAGSQGSALSYIPETVWNESGGSGLWSSGGGASITYAKPSWQVGTGVPGDGKRDVPDVSLTAAGHDGYLIEMSGSLGVVGGTSAASPSFAGLMALVVQSTGSPQGNANTAFYSLASRQQSGGAAIFHDTASGSNSVPGLTGFNAGAGYDLATGLGSVDANLLATHWGDAGSVPALQFSGASNSLTVPVAGSNALNLSATVSGGFNSAVTLSATGLPAGVTASFNPSSLAAPGSGSAVLTLFASSGARTGSYSASVVAAGGGLTKNVPLTVVVNLPPSFTFAGSPTSFTLLPAKPASMTLTTTVNATLKSVISLSVSGLPAGVTAKFSRTSIPSPGSGTSTFTMTASTSAVPGTYTAVITAAGAGIVHTVPLTVNVAGFTLSGSASVAAAPGTRGTATFTTHAVGGFSSAVAFSLSGAPAGVTAAFSPASIAGGSGTTILTLTSATSATPGIYSGRVTATGAGITRTLSITLSVPSFTLSGAPATSSVKPGATAVITLNTRLAGGFNSAVTFSASGLPGGVTASFNPPTIGAPGSGAAVLTLTATSSATPSTYTIVIAASGGGITRSQTTKLNVPTFTLAASPGSVSLAPGAKGSVALTTRGLGGFSSSIALSVSGLPAGVTVSLAPGSVAAPGNGSIKLTLTRGSTAQVSVSTLTLIATGGGTVKTTNLTLSVTR